MAGATPKDTPSVLSYDDHRAFLRDLFAWRKAKDPAFSHLAFARRSGLASKSHLKSVLDYGMRLTPGAVEKYIAGFRLAGKEAEGLRLLVRASQAEEGPAREAALDALRRFRYEVEVREVPQPAAAQALQWANYLVMASRRLRGFRADPVWISRKLGGRITPAEARAAIRFLKESGYLRLRGRRLVGAPAGMMHARRQAFPDGDALRNRLHLEATRSDGDFFSGALVLSRDQAKALSARMMDTMKAAIPRPGPGKGKGDLCIVMGHVFPLA